MRNYYIFISLLGAVVFAGLIIGFKVGGNPEDLKNSSYDNNTTMAFSTIKSSIQSYYQTNSKLPVSLADLNLPSGSLKNSKTQEAFTYTTDSPTSYKLCTQFFTNSTDLINKNNYLSYIPEVTNHKKGIDCVTTNVLVSAPIVPNPVNSIKEEVVSMQYSKIDPLSSSVGQTMGLITTDKKLIIRVGPQAHIYQEASESSYYLLAINVSPMCPATATETCEFLLSDLTLKTKDGITIVKNIPGDSLYSPYVQKNIGEIDPRYNVAPNTQMGGSLGFHIPTYLLQEKTPTEFFMSYHNSEPLTLTLTFNNK